MTNLRLVVVLLCLVGCGQETQPKPPESSSKPLPPEIRKPVEPPPPSDVLTGKAGDVTITARLSGKIEPGARVNYSLTVDRPVAALRLWVGTEDGAGSMKTKAHPGHGGSAGLHAHVEVPDPLPKGARLWVEVENERGERSLTSLPLR